MSRFGLGFVSGGGTPGNDSFVKALLHFDGANGSQVFPDANASGVSNTWTASGPSSLTTSNSKFGAACLSNNNGNGVRTAAKSAFNPGSGPFTIDFQLNPNSTSGTRYVAGLGNSTINPTQYSWEIILDHVGSKITPSFSNGSNQYFGTSASSLPSFSWTHVAVVRNGNTIFLYLNGVLDLTFGISGSLQPGVGNLVVGSTGSGGGQVILVDEFRYSVGIARWTANFTPPVSAYT